MTNNNSWSGGGDRAPPYLRDGQWCRVCGWTAGTPMTPMSGLFYSGLRSPASGIQLGRDGLRWAVQWAALFSQRAAQVVSGLCNRGLVPGMRGSSDFRNAEPE